MREPVPPAIAGGPPRDSTIDVRVDEGIALVTLSRPEVRNAIDGRMVRDLHAAFDALAADGATRVVIVTGKGTQAFASGADIRDLRARRAADALRGINSTLFLKIEQSPLPTIAAVNGYALGGGCELALACDIRLAAASARFGQPEVGLGIIPAAGATARLPRIVGMGRARELILTGRIIDAEEALRIGLVTGVVPDARLLDEARAVAAAIAGKSPMALAAAKMALAASVYGPDAGHAADRLAQGMLFDGADKEEGMSAFLERRPPRFRK